MDQDEAKSNENHSSSSRDSNPCPICLGPFLQESYLDSCFHKFCYSCILNWTKVVAGKHSPAPSSVKCPLCKTENLSIIYGYDGSSFQRQYINDSFELSSFFSKAHKYRLKCYYTEPGILSNVVNILRYWKSRKYLQPNRWLQSWLRREIQALLQEEDVEIIVHHILGVVDSFLRRGDQSHQMRTPETKQVEFKNLVSDAARPFLAARTERFVNELELFLASGLNIEAYDEVYMQQLGWNTPRLTGEGADVEHSEHTPIVPYLYIFDDDSDETD
ncbi:hypothetical protein P3X46_035148 [Hevea brasiliensis]|uniref:RING-type domain-containing protein n=1 Tax=Hevea brasiliensis TaxID=3981 RepID=A0ABQ9KC35_HEVBR|nr:uncharacterized protein LOC131177650 isoform X1 [Hevea brasiliensis]XP_057998712.1 uncharacterized protein LOC131177650 isoform X1 [Hevea brasiliensis]XP_057998713.1 uncharacterized protein LOC131177650 isoform X1 [Hevea brasiliensis]XP_057998714.1 uncharacterized protein LOC131177650 isoform X1 [Hevea brasiliensis]KAJ9131492.1 hypothetical protein P3X46_035148 [Hevea brasiliensis]